MIRVALLAALGVVAAAVPVASVSMTHLDSGPRATPASRLHEFATPAATPVSASPFGVPGSVPVSLTIQNAGSADRLLGGSSPIAMRVVPHQSRLIDGRRVMEASPAGIPIPAGTTIILEPAASHLMLFGLTTDLVQGETFPLTFRFERAGEATVTVRVRRKVDAAGIEPIPPVSAGDLTLSLASAPPAPAAAPAT